MKRQKHSLSHYRLLTCDMGELVPCGLMEVLPGDTVQQASSILARVSPLVAPVMHPVHVRIHHWFVPHRLVWDDFEKFITGGPTGDDASVLPKITMTPAEGSLADYMGLPTGTSISVSALPFRAYDLIYNELYRDQDLQPEVVFSKASGADSTTDVTLQNVNWEKDYFTTSRPWTQKGTQVGIAGQVQGDNNFIYWRSTNVDTADRMVSLLGAVANKPLTLQSSTETATSGMKFSNDPTRSGLKTVIDIQDLKTSIGLQKFAENRAQFGSRYSEYLRYLGIKSRDSRLDRPEYLGGGRQTIQFSEVLQMGPNFDANTGVGNLKGHGIGAVRSNRYRRFFEEHGYVISLMSVMPKTMYAQGVAKHWSRMTNEDFYQQELANIGQAEVYNREIYAAHGTPAGVFGYQDRYDEYRRMESWISGEFRSTLNHWHLARIFTADPALNDAFVTANPTKRVLASTGTDGLLCMVNHSIQARRMVGRR